jgi:UDP-N-acetylmuramoyl-L-alanyl-D-glutamate--2,6-diaminopimelate ligase
MYLDEIRQALPEVTWHNYQNVKITGVQQDSRKVTGGSLFTAIKGAKAHGNDYIADALRRGAVAIISEESQPVAVPTKVPLGVANEARDLVARLGALWSDYAARQLTVIGITGTNGKTTTAFMMHSILQAGGRPSALLGTIGYWYGQEFFPAPNTTPDVLFLHEHFARMRTMGITHVAMEVSSHSLVQKRVAEIPFTAAIFTNLGRDHLDYHATVENYRDAKGLLFAGLAPQAHAVLNGNDATSDHFCRLTKAKVHRFGINGEAEICATDIHYSGLSTSFTLSMPSVCVSVAINFPGLYNVYNALGAAGAAWALGIPPDAIAAGLADLQGVPGRMEQVDEGQPFLVVVDYAHTPNAMEAALSTLYKIKRQRLFVVFGCGGDRDQGKRPQMGKIAAQYGDFTWITSDNPRTEPPEKIAKQIAEGVGNAPHLVVLDREEAIRRILEAAQPNDIVVIAGKGHETEQIIGKQVLPFDDRAVARKYLRQLYGQNLGIPT